MTSEVEPAEVCPFCKTADCRQSPRFAADKAARVADLQASIDALGNEGKPEREQWVVRELLLNLGKRFDAIDLVSVAKKDEPPDVLFEAARFEVKELYDEGRQRGDEYKQLLREAQAAEQCAQLRPLTPASSRDTSLSEVLELAIAVGAKHSQRYDATLVPKLDLLLYHNLVDMYGMPDTPFPAATKLCAQGWRSVSVLSGHRAIVFCATPNAPAWIRAVAGTVKHRPALTATTT